ncbi:FAD/NAD(P)-binding domain-containing protein [Jaminaea rosea]|uniref:FAD/NAD(P)-binding domain-containing protein n=1 Tax=Jaminaea rosea TaxID=1569628 RepID=A0A316V0L7_9BASI|nr:FAD/NAD(P)-binding domain-containing protein [Jaminaea rosea]PWN30538.1 FAD/NAD(P)-binding domain-containing protein [Jaminaea rosea]
MAQEGDENAYTHLILGTSLALSILSASLCQTRNTRVLQVDANDYYGGPNASLTLKQLEDYLAGLPSSSQARMTFPAFDAQGQAKEIPSQLAALDRHYSLSLTPALLAAHGPALDALVRSKVANYATFRLLQRTAVYDGYSAEASSSQSSRLRPVPSSKEDVFKTPATVLSLLDKRKLMKLLQWCATASLDDRYTGEESGDDPTLAAALASPNLHSFLEAQQRLSPSLSTAIAYGLCHSPDARSEPCLPALKRLQTHLRSTGKYGNAAYLVAQYGGAGELVQGYARAAAVGGATFVLGRRVEKCERKDGQDVYDVRVQGVDETFRCGKVVGTKRDLTRLGLHAGPSRTAAEATTSTSTLQGLLILDRGVQMPSSAATETSSNDADEPQKPEPPIETALIVFPPHSLALGDSKDDTSPVTVTALVLGEGTFCCPKGQYVVQITAAGLPAESQGQASRLFDAAKQAVLGLASESEVEWKKERSEGAGHVGGGVSGSPAGAEAILPLMEAFWLSVDDDQEEIIEVLDAATPTSSLAPTTTSAGLSLLSTTLESSTNQAESLFYSLHGILTPPYPDATAQRKRGGRRRRDPAEYRGRAGAGPEDEEDEGEGREREEDKEDEGPLFFPVEQKRGDDEEEEA